MMLCNHPVTRTLRTTPFSAPVAYDADPRAHGNICVTIECVTCGAQRLENRNATIEVGPWSHAERDLTAAERISRAAAQEWHTVEAQRQRLVHASKPDEYRVCVRDVEVRVWLDGEACIVVQRQDGRPMNADVETAAIEAAPVGWVASAADLRRAYVAAREARESTLR